MEFRPCIDIHNGKVKQIVGSSIKDSTDSVNENFVSDRDSVYYARLYESHNLKGGHVILLNASGTQTYEDTKAEAIRALNAYKNGLQVGGGINAENAKEFIEAGASHVIVTSYAFSDGKICYNNLTKLREAVSKEKIVLDMSCRAKDGRYYVVTNRWQCFTDAELTEALLFDLSEYCDEFLIHAVDVEGKQSGIDETVLNILKKSPIPVTYAGGISSIDDILKIKELGSGKVNFTVGSALDLFGGSLKLLEVLDCIQ